MIFADTSVFVCAVTPYDTRSEACREILINSAAEGVACAVHSLAEIYSSLSGRPRPYKMPPRDAAAVVADIRKRCKVISLTATEYLSTIERLAERGHSGGIIYDGLLMACARKSGATHIYTANARDFRTVAPDLAEYIRSL